MTNTSFPICKREQWYWPVCRVRERSHTSLALPPRHKLLRMPNNEWIAVNIAFWRHTVPELWLLGGLSLLPVDCEHGHLGNESLGKFSPVPGAAQLWMSSGFFVSLSSQLWKTRKDVLLFTGKGYRTTRRFRDAALSVNFSAAGMASATPSRHAYRRWLAPGIL